MLKNLSTTYDYKSPGLIGRTFFYGGLQIRRDAWRASDTHSFARCSDDLKPYIYITFKHIYLRLSTKFDIDFNFFKILT